MAASPRLLKRLAAISLLIHDFETFIKGGPCGSTFRDTLRDLQAARSVIVKQLRGIE